VSASGAEERSSSLRGGAFRAMNKQPTHNGDFLRSIPGTLQHLFLPGRDPAYIYWILGAVTLLGMVLRLWRMGQPIAYDEAYTFLNFAIRDVKHILADYSAPNNHIFHTLLVRISYALFGDQAWMVRVPAFLAGTLCIPAAFFTARRMFGCPESLAAAALVALTPWFIDYSANGRGYTLIILFSLLLANLGALLIQQQSRLALAAYAVIAALGFYTIPIFLYPMAGVSLWVLVSHLTTNEPRRERSANARAFLAACVSTGLLVFLLYSPVILFGTGLDSITSNEFVESRDGAMFIENLGPRAVRTWESWMIGIGQTVQYLLLGGFLLSLLFYKRLARQRWPLPLFLIAAIAILLVIQQVAPLARVWIYLEAFYVMFAGAGLAWLAGILFHRLDTRTAWLVPMVTLLIVIGVFIFQYVEVSQASANRDRSPEEYAAEFLASHLQAGDKILATAPVDIQTAYYLQMKGVPYDTFYRRDRAEKAEHPIILLRTGTRYNTPEGVLDFYQLTSEFDPGSFRRIYEYGPVQIFSIPSR
jgi:4-amino-4-deoxy-L-arabinose transferase-like glycosyltransferase